ncbi:MAG: hypothetical protein QF500_02610 [Candidatus Thalassarchaeaceae archaeon]|nr:hypothetical protein [Candidatus Thalassarchaeaceae archaeon]
MRDAAATKIEDALIDKIVAVEEMVVVEDTTAEAIEIDADKIEDEVDKMVTVEATGIVQNVRILTLHSELNVTAVKPQNHKEVVVAQIIKEAEMMEEEEIAVMEEEEIAVMEIAVEIGLVQNVRTQTLHSEINAIAVKPTSLVVEAVAAAIGIGRTARIGLLENNQEKATEEVQEAETVEDSEMEILDKVEIREEEAQVVRIDLEGADSVGQPEAGTVEIGPVEVAVEDENYYQNSIIQSKILDPSIHLSKA